MPAAGTSTATFVGREPELAALSAALAGALAARPRLVVVGGEAGIGKSSLIACFRDRAEGARVIAASGDAAEADLALGVIDQVLRQLGRAGEAGDHIAAGNALLEALGTAGAVALIIDDAHWADAPSLAALSFVARRLVADTVLLVLATRTPATLPEGLRKAAAQQLDLAPLSLGETIALARGLGVELSPRAARRLQAHTAGNPLYTRELVLTLPAAAWNDEDRPLPAPASYSTLIAERVRAATPGARALVEATAVLGSRVPLSLAGPLAALAEPLAALDESLAAGLLTWDGFDALGFPHPLVRAAVHDQLGAARRAALHAGAAELIEDEAESLRHVAVAAVAPDDAAAERLERFAAHPDARRDRPAVAAALAAASRLSSTRADRERRLLRSIEWRFMAGDLGAAEAQAADVARMEPGPRRDNVLARLALWSGRSDEAAALSAAAWEGVDRVADAELAAVIAFDRAFAALITLDDEAVVRWANAALDLAPAHAGAVGWTGSLALALWRLGRADEARAAVARVEAGHDDVRAQVAGIRGWLAFLDDDLAEAVADLDAAVEAELRLGAYSVASVQLCVLARARFAAGAWGEAVVAAERAVTLSSELRQPAAQAFAWWAATAVPAAQGRSDRAEHYARLAAGAPRRPPDRLVATGVTQALVHAAKGEHERVLEALHGVAAIGGAADAPGFWPWQDLYGAALVALGRHDEADAFLAPHEAQARQRAHRSMQGKLAPVRGTLEAARGNRDEAHAHFVAATEGLDAIGMPYEAALARLAHGQALRRIGRRRAAGEVLTAAREVLAALGAAPALERCERELSAAGLRSAPEGTTLPQLTSQEQAVAALVARGASNKEVAQELMISVRTVEVHLTRAYAKLGITSRSALAARLAT